MIAATCLTLLTGCRGGSPTTPEPGTPTYVGTWTGHISSEAVGAGTLEVIFDMQRNGPASPLVSGTATPVFPDARLNGSRAVVGAFSPDGLFGLTFDRGTVPCPAADDGVAARSMFASLTVVGNRMSGTYIAGGCPGGSMELTKR
jgi:hypothetical protein